MAKRYNREVTPQNTPRFRERRILFLLAMGMFCVNLVLAALLNADDAAALLAHVGLVVLFSVVQSLDSRKEFWTWGYLLFWITLFVGVSAAIILWHRAYVFFALLALELLGFAAVAWVLLKRNRVDVEGKKHLVFYPIWKCEMLDAYLSDMEREGYRLTGGKWGFLFWFRKCEAKNVRYFCTFTRLKERSMWGIEDVLRSEYRANPVPTGTGQMQIHRITDLSLDLKDLDNLRWNAMPAVLLERFFIAVVVPALLLCIAIRMQLAVLLQVALMLLILSTVDCAIGLYRVGTKKRRYVEE